MVNDPMVVKIKAFRILNKRAGEHKRVAMDDTKSMGEREIAVNQYQTACKKLTSLAKEFDTAGYHIWVNFDGTTGHTYPKDYKLTNDLTNDWDAYVAEVKNRESAVQEVIDGINTEADDDDHDHDHDPLMN
jgi:hypothetical protein